MTDQYIIIGDGVAGATAAENIRDEDEDAEIHVFTDETEPLYNRIMLKTYMKGSLPKQYTRLHDKDWYEKRDIKLHLETPVTDVDTEEKEIETEEGCYSYDRCLVATGGSPRKLPEDEGFDNLHYVWTKGDAETVKDSAEESEKAVVVGGGLLGIDLAVAYAENDCETYYLIKDECWWSRGLDEEGAEIVHRKLEELGVKIVTGVTVDELSAEDGEIEEVVDTEGREYEADALAVAIGQTPNSDLIDVEKNEAGMIKTGRFLETSAEGVYAAGNMVDYESVVFEGRTVNGSWDHSEAMGECAAKNMIGQDSEFDYVNTYGVGHFDVQFLAVGDWSGEPASKKYSEDEYRRLFFDGDRLVGAVMIGRTENQKQIREAIKEKKEVGEEEYL